MEFGVNVHSLDGIADHIRRVDALGYDVLAAADHLGAYDPFAVLAAASQLSDRLRLRTYVLNAGFHRAAFVARSVVTLDDLSGARAELGLGAGYAREEFEDAGLPYASYEQRLGTMEQLLVDVVDRLAPRRVPIVVGANSERGLATAARHADIVAFSGLRIARGGLRLASAAEADASVALVRELAGGRPYVSDVLLQAVTVDGDPGEQARAWDPDSPLAIDDLLASPYTLFAPSAEAAAEELERRHERWGFTSVTTHAPYMEALGLVIARMASK